MRLSRGYFKTINLPQLLLVFVHVHVFRFEFKAHPKEESNQLKGVDTGRLWTTVKYDLKICTNVGLEQQENKKEVLEHAF